MIPIRNKNIVVLGLGLHGGGVATTKWLHSQGANLVVTDLRSETVLASSVAQLERYSNITYVFGKHRKKDIDWAEYVVVNPGVPQESEYVQYARAKGKQIYNEATLFFDRCTAPVIAVTGTRGKSTTAHVIAHICAQKNKRTILAGNIRSTFLLDVVDRATNKDVVVVELSSWQLEGMQPIQAAPDIAVVTNLMRDHLNRYPSLAKYHVAKKEIWKYQHPEQVVVLSADDERLQKWAHKTQAHTLFFSKKKLKHQGAYLSQGAIWYQDAHKKSEKICAASEVSLEGEHNLSNILAAVTAAKAFGVSTKDITKALKTIPPLSGRQEVIATIDGVQYINDTTATTPDAGIVGLQRFGTTKKNIVLIAGGADKKLQYTEWARVVKKYAKRVLLLDGDASEKQKKALGSFKHIDAGFMVLEDALAVAQLYVEKGDCVLFSPSAASFNMWLHEFERGASFERAVADLKAYGEKKHS